MAVEYLPYRIIGEQHGWSDVHGHGHCYVRAAPRSTAPVGDGQVPGKVVKIGLSTALGIWDLSVHPRDLSNDRKAITIPDAEGCASP